MASQSDPLDAFAQAIANRFKDAGGPPMLTARLSPALFSPRVRAPYQTIDAQMVSRSPVARPIPPARPQPKGSPDTSFQPTTASQLAAVLSSPNILVLDIRPHAAYCSARLPHAISLSVPSTLIKRPAFTLEKLATMIPDSSSRARFSAWRKASRILVYDADSPALHDGSNVLGLLRKFVAEGFAADDIAWLQGGIQTLWRDKQLHHLIDTEPPLSEDDDDHRPGPPSSTFLRARNLPMSAFQSSSTTALSQQKHFFTPARSTAPAPANPFYDNIRQNIELASGITDRIPLSLPASVHTRFAAAAAAIPKEWLWLRDIERAASCGESTETLAMQFYKIELGEQRRLQSIMEHHSRVDSGKKKDAFPFSITAGVEKGTKNRYRNIWPFEHARVRLQGKDSDSDDYVNASYIQPLGTNRRYIATQGPLPSTFNDFWTLCWEQNVHVIVMLTQQVEGATVKCGNYWSDGAYGVYRLKMIEQVGSPEEGNPDEPSIVLGQQRASGGDGFNFGFFGSVSTPDPEPGPVISPPNAHNSTIRRTFELTNSLLPDVPPRIVTQLQYLAWPDMDVPQDPSGVLKLVKEVDRVVDRARPAAVEGLGAAGARIPVLLHCSAGVGRTGGFIVVDAILDGLRRDLRRATYKKTMKAKKYADGVLVGMDVDGSPTSSPSNSSKEDVLIGVSPDAAADAPILAWSRDTNTATGTGSASPPDILPISSDAEMEVDEVQAAQLKAEARGRERAQARQQLRDLDLEQDIWFTPISKSKGKAKSKGKGSNREVSPMSSEDSDEEREEESQLSMSPPASSPPPSTPARSGSGSSGSGSGSGSSLSVGKPMASLSFEHSPLEQIKQKFAQSLVLPPIPTFSSSTTLRGRASSTSPPTLALGPSPMPKHVPSTEYSQSSSDPLPIPVSLSSSSSSSSVSALKAYHPTSVRSSVSSSSSSHNSGSGVQTPISSATSTFTHLKGQAQPGAPAQAQALTPGQLARTDSDEKSSPSPPVHSDAEVNYAKPRGLHRDDSPPPLSTYEEPIRQVLEDMREQRMSLCQSLRQYVFVHRAIIEGALDILAEEQEREREGKGKLGGGSGESAGEESTGTDTSLSGKEKEVAEADRSEGESEGGDKAPPLRALSAVTGKRGASPTELVEESKRGDLLLHKRPSLRRKTTVEEA